MSAERGERVDENGLRLGGAPFDQRALVAAGCAGGQSVPPDLRRRGNERKIDRHGAVLGKAIDGGQIGGQPIRVRLVDALDQRV